MIASLRSESVSRTQTVQRIACAGLMLVGVISGCGGGQENWLPVPKDPAYPVRGKVVLPNGKPLNSGRIEFWPVKDPGLIAYGEIAADGTFELQTRKPGDGALPGDYKIKIMIPEKRQFARLSRYRDEDSSRLTARIKPEDNNLSPFRLK